MLRFSAALRDARLRKIALRIFQEDQTKTNESLAPLSAVQRRKVIQKLFKALPPMDKERLTARATTLKTQMDAQDLDLRTAVQGVQSRRKGPQITPYEMFVMEQRGNPAIVALPNPRDREIKLMEIYQSLPDKAKEVWEKRAEMAVVSPPARTLKPRRSPVRRRKPASKKIKRKAASKAKKPSAVKSTAKKQKKQKRPRPPTGYTLFVKEQMAMLTDMAQTERMAEVGRRWRDLSPEARAKRMADAGATAPKQTPAPSSNASEKTTGPRATPDVEPAASTCTITPAATPELPAAHTASEPPVSPSPTADPVAAASSTPETEASPTEAAADAAVEPVVTPPEHKVNAPVDDAEVPATRAEPAKKKKKKVMVKKKLRVNTAAVPAAAPREHQQKSADAPPSATSASSSSTT